MRHWLVGPSRSKAASSRRAGTPQTQDRVTCLCKTHANRCVPQRRCFVLILSPDDGLRSRHIPVRRSPPAARSLMFLGSRIPEAALLPNDDGDAVARASAKGWQRCVSAQQPHSEQGERIDFM
jgi:hypothetical protein